MSYVPRLAKVANFLAIRQVKQGTETTKVASICIVAKKTYACRLQNRAQYFDKYLYADHSYLRFSF